jgi:hypothetical protein
MFFVNSNRPRCGCHSLGLLAYDAIKDLGFVYTENLELLPRNSIYLFNWHPGTNLSVITKDALNWLRGKSLGFLHDPYHVGFFDANLRLDPTFQDSANYFGMPRIIPEHTFSFVKPPNGEISVGSWGFGLMHKNFFKVIELVETQLENATLRLHIPFSDWCDPNGGSALNIAQTCKNLMRKNKIEITHEYMALNDFVKWANRNSVNIFTCDENIVAGVSSCIDMALMAKRPIGVNKCMMYKGIYSDKTCLSKNSLLHLINGDQSHLDEFRQNWAPEKFKEKIQHILNHV